MKELLQTLIEFQTITGNFATNNEALDRITTYLAERGMFVERREWNSYESLYASTQNTKTPKVLLSAHLDVVPGEPEMFELREENGKFFGRGVFDMKFAIAAYLDVVDKIKDHLHEYDFGIMITTDEEFGGYNGANKFVEEGYIPEVAIIPDGGDNWKLETHAKTITWATITTYGKSSHASRPWEGESAFEKMLSLLDEIKTLFPSPGKTTDTFVVGQIQSGEATNQLPAGAEAHIDIRCMTNERQQEVNQHLKDLCQKYGATLTIDVFDPACINDISNPYLAQFITTIQEVTGNPSGETSSFASTDGRFFSRAGVPCVIVRPPGGKLHGPDEWIGSQGLEQLGEVILRYLQTTA